MPRMGFYNNKTPKQNGRVERSHRKDQEKI